GVRGLYPDGSDPGRVIRSARLEKPGGGLSAGSIQQKGRRNRSRIKKVAQFQTGSHIIADAFSVRLAGWPASESQSNAKRIRPERWNPTAVARANGGSISPKKSSRTIP